MAMAISGIWRPDPWGFPESGDLTPGASHGSLSTDSDGRIVNWTWDFGDGNSGRGEKTTHAYAKAGTYSVTLKVIDNDGGSDVSEKTVTISDLEL